MIDWLAFELFIVKENKYLLFYINYFSINEFMKDFKWKNNKKWCFEENINWKISISIFQTNLIISCFSFLRENYNKIIIFYYLW